MEIVFATNNLNKVREVQMLLPQNLKIKSLKDIECSEEIPETSPTIAGNALQKARYVKEHYGADCFSEDTGLEVEALDGAPGVYSARFAGPERDAAANTKLLLQKLSTFNNRKAQFRTVIALILDGQEYTFEGIAKGEILPVPRSSGGFGYDPVFQPQGYQKTFAELSMEEKNRISHRGKAVQQLIEFLDHYVRY